jgi:hypothetical protein
MKKTALLSLLPLIVTVSSLSGCGSTTGDPSASKLVASQDCIGCHSATISHVTGLSIASEWTASAHNTGNGAGCRDCHEPTAGHPSSCSRCHGGGAPTGTADHDVMNPDTKGKCGNCHGLHLPNDVMMKNAPRHFGNMTATTDRSKRASYVSTMYVGACRKCHNPHNPTGQKKQLRDWADSAHANTASGARNTDFKTRGTYQQASLTFQNYCLRCHTSTGYIRFVTSGFTDLRPFGDPVVQNGVPGVTAVISPDKTKELTNCDVCHDDGNGNSYSFKLRDVPPVVIYYNVSTTRVPIVKLNGNDSRVEYPDAASSNICVPCHSGGRGGVGRMIRIAAAKFMNFSNASNLTSSHQLAASQTLFMTGGYEYEGRVYSSTAGFLHNRIGTGNILNTGAKGPCIACHAQTERPHLFDPVVLTPNSAASVTAITSRICANCHNGTAISGTLLPAWKADGSNLQGRKASFHAALTVLSALISTSGPIGSTNWARYGKVNGPNTMGASSNYNLLRAERGSYIHNDIYARRLIYDSIDWLYNGNLDDDVIAAISDTNKVKLPSGTKNAVTGVVYTDTEIAGLRATAIAYILGPEGHRP